MSRATEAKGHEKSAPACSLYVIPAADGRSAVVFRRGPSKRIMLARWWLDDDRIEHGHWFAGRLHERQCDVSPDGELLLYFAASYKREIRTWTAISRPPYLTALVMWTCYGSGGGYFDADRSIVLNPFVSTEPLRSANRSLQPFPEDQLRQHLNSRQMAEDDDWCRYYCPEHGRLVRDGWQCTQEGVQIVQEPYVNPQYYLVEPQIYEREMPQRGRRSVGVVLRRTFTIGTNYEGTEKFDLVDPSGTPLRALTGSTWADWQATGDLLFAHAGCLYRIKRSAVLKPASDALEGAHLVHDFRALTFTKRKPPAWATTWPS